MTVFLLSQLLSMVVGAQALLQCQLWGSDHCWERNWSVASYRHSKQIMYCLCTKDKHRCLKNWDASSSEMETDVVVEGFTEAERVHGVHYITLIGDGDSSVYPSLIQRVPGYGHCIQKLECANHACKCYRGALEKLVHDNPSYKGRGGLTEKMRRKQVSGA